MTIAIALFTVFGTLGFMYFQRKKLNTQYAHMRAAEVARRLGMQVVEGRPDHNLTTQSVQPSVQNIGSAGGFLRQVAATQVGGTLGEFKLHLQGAAHGMPTELVLFCRQDLQTGLTRNTTTTWYDLRLTVHARAALVPFELRLRSELAGLETRRGEVPVMPVQGFGLAALDQRYVIESFEPGLPARIAAALAALPPHLVYLRIVGSHDRVSFVMTPAAVNASATSFEQLQHVVASIVASLEGRALPAQVAA